MKKRNRFFAVFLTITLMLLVLPFKVSANSPGPTPWYTIELENLPAGTVYVDMLIYLPADDPMYTELESANLPDGLSKKRGDYHLL